MAFRQPSDGNRLEQYGIERLHSLRVTRLVRWVGQDADWEHRDYEVTVYRHAPGQREVFHPVLCPQDYVAGRYVAYVNDVKVSPYVFDEALRRLGLSTTRAAIAGATPKPSFPSNIVTKNDRPVTTRSE